MHTEKCEDSIAVVYRCNELKLALSACYYWFIAQSIFSINFFARVSLEPSRWIPFHIWFEIEYSEIKQKKRFINTLLSVALTWRTSRWPGRWRCTAPSAEAEGWRNLLQIKSFISLVFIWFSYFVNLKTGWNWADRNNEVRLPHIQSNAICIFKVRNLTWGIEDDVGGSRHQALVEVHQAHLQQSKSLEGLKYQGLLYWFKIRVFSKSYIILEK